jgi:ubiquinone/menaquinone biosynthesis C-methylase UbiE
MNSKERFSNRVSDYMRYRPSYPSAVLDVLRSECGLTPQSVITDVGSGTGILTKLFLENGNNVYGVEPNAAMRKAGEEFLRDYARFRSVNGSAENTALPNSSVDFVTAGQAFHWFDLTATRAEFQRILKPHGFAAIISNERLHDTTPFLREYEDLLRKYGTDYEKVAETYTKQQRMKEFFGSVNYGTKTFPNEQVFDFDGLRGRLLSSSYAPREGHPNHDPMLAALRHLFEAHQQNGAVRFGYRTNVTYGQFPPR